MIINYELHKIDSLEEKNYILLMIKMNKYMENLNKNQ